MPKKRCPKCRSVNTQKRGSYEIESLRDSGKRRRRIQRYCCLECHRWFSGRAKAGCIKQYEPSLILKAADLYFNAEASYQAVDRQIHVRPYQLFLWINELGKNSKSFEEVARELSPVYSGCFLADATSVSIEGEKQQLLLSADVESQGTPYAALCEKEDYPSWKMVLQGLKD